MLKSRWLALLVLNLALSSCGGKQYDGSTSTGRAAAIDAVNLALARGDCSEAIKIIDPIYASKNVDNEIRMMRASAYSCAANFQFFPFIGDIAGNASKLAGAQFWNVMTQIFPSDSSDPEDRVVEGAQGAMDAVMAALKPGIVRVESNIFNFDDPETDFNPASVVASDRMPDANIYLAFMSMMHIGAIQNRYGSPDPTTYSKGSDLPWTTATASGMTGDGCAYASSLINFIDGLKAMEGAFTGDSAERFATVREAFESVIGAACNFGCLGIQGVGLDAAPVDGWVASGCAGNIPAGCDGCPLALRNRKSCTGENTDPSSCAAAGLVNFINKHQLGWVE